MQGWSRRQFLEIVGLGGGAAIGLGTGLLPKVASAATANNQLLLFVYFSGGHDELLCWDPRDYTKPQFAQANAYPGSPNSYNNMGMGSGIWPAYDLCVDPYIKSVLAANPSGVQQPGVGALSSLTPSNLTFGPAVAPSFLQHAADLALVRGMNMETLTHEVGRRYWLTGMFPAGLNARGSSLTSNVAYQENSQLDLPNLSISTETYNAGLPAFASGVNVNFSSDMALVLKQLGLQLSTPSENALKQFQDSSDSCADHEMNGIGLVDMFRASQVKARSMTNSVNAGLFSFAVPSQCPPSGTPTDVQNLMCAMQIAKSSDLTGPKGKAAIAGMALAKGISTAVSVQIQGNMDDHFEWDLHHGTTLNQGFDALGLLISYLKSMPALGGGSGTVWDNTTMVVFSEFSRTPLVNSRNGRDHHLSSSCCVAGPGLKKNVVIGATADINLAFQPIDTTTGQVQLNTSAPNAWVVRPPDVHVTVLQSMGLSPAYLSNQAPSVISALLK